MLAFLFIVLVPAMLLFAGLPVVMFGLMRESLAAHAPARTSNVSWRDEHADFALSDACVPSSA